jgi:hypothetical protein
MRARRTEFERLAMDHPGPILLAALVTLFAWLVFRHRYAFVVCVGPAGPRVARGKVTPAFLRLIAEVCAQNRLASGKICGVWRGRTIALAFSRTIPLGCQQQLRNLWALHGW